MFWFNNVIFFLNYLTYICQYDLDESILFRCYSKNNNKNL